MVSVFFSLLGFLITIGIVVIIHEGGHYLAAKQLGFAVKRFSIGMGKVLWRRRAWDTEFAVSLLPIGGYVAFEDDEEDEKDAKEKAPEACRPRAQGIRFETGPRWKKALVIAAGPLMNFILAVMLFAVSGAIGVRDIVPYVVPAEHSQAEALGVKPMDRVIAVEGRRIAGIMDFNTAVLERAGSSNLAIEFKRDGSDETYVRRFDLTDVTLDEASKSKGFIFPKLGLYLGTRSVQLAEVMSGGPAEQAGLKAHDVITHVDGKPADMSAFAQMIQSSPEKALKLSVQRGRGEETFEVTLIPRSEVNAETGKLTGRADLRFGPGLDFVTVRLSPWQAISNAVSRVAGVTRLQVNAVGGMASGEVSAETLSGPVGIAGMAGTALTAGLTVFIEFVALISVAIGFMNLIPIPALDGGQLVILALEGALRKTFSRGFKEKLGMASMALLLALAVYVTVNDIGRLGG